MNMKTWIAMLMALVLSAMPTAMSAKRIVYLKSQSGAEASYKGEVNDRDEPSGQGEVSVTRGENVLVGNGDEILHLTGLFTADGVTNAVLTLGTQPQMTFRGQLKYTVTAATSNARQYEQQVLNYEKRAQTYLANLGKYQRAKDFLTDVERQTTYKGLVAEQKQLADDYLAMWSHSTGISSRDGDSYAVFRITLQQGTLEMAKWNIVNGADICREKYTIMKEFPVELLFACNNGEVKLLSDIVSRSTDDELRLTGDVVGGCYVEDVRMFHLVPRDKICPPALSRADLDDAAGVMQKQKYYRERFGTQLRANYLKMRRKADGQDQQVIVTTNGVRIITPATSANDFFAWKCEAPTRPFLELNNDGLAITAHTLSASQERCALDQIPADLIDEALRLKLNPQLEVQPKEEVAATPDPAPAAVVAPEPTVDVGRLKLNLMSDKNLLGPWVEEGSTEQRIWTFRADSTLSLRSLVPLNYSLGIVNVKMNAQQERIERRWSLNNHQLHFRNIPLTIASFELDYDASDEQYSTAQKRVIDDALPAFRQLVKETQQQEWQNVVGKTYAYTIVSFEPERMEVQTDSGKTVVLLRDPRTMSANELKTYRAATATFRDRLQAMTAPTPQPAEAIATPQSAVQTAAADTQAVTAEPQTAATKPQTAASESKATEPQAEPQAAATATTTPTESPFIQRVIDKIPRLKFGIPKMGR